MAKKSVKLGLRSGSAVESGDVNVTYNGVRIAGLYTNAFYHVWRIYSTSPFAPAAVFDTTGSPAVTAIDVIPATANSVKGGNVQFSAAVTATGFVDQSVTWTLTGANKTATTIDAAGNLHIASDETATSITVTATSNATGTVYDTATVTVYDNLPVYEGQIVIGG